MANVPVLLINKNWFTNTTVVEGNWDNIRGPLLIWANNMSLDLKQLTTDIFGAGYSFNETGNPSLSTSFYEQFTDLVVVVDAIISGGVPILGTTNATWSINIDDAAQRLILSSSGLTGSRTILFPDSNTTVLGNNTTQNVSGKTFTDNLVFLSGTLFQGIFDHANTADRTYTLPDASGTLLLSGVPFSGNVDILNGFDLRLYSDAGVTLTASIDGATGDFNTNGSITFKSATAFDGLFDHANTVNRTYTFPDVTGNVPVLPTAATTETGTGAIVRDTSPSITTPTLGTPVIANFTSATHPHLDAAGGGTLDAAAIASGTFDIARIPVSSIDHNSLTNLTVGDPHTQYAELAGNETVTGNWTFPAAPATPTANATYREFMPKVVYHGSVVATVLTTLFSGNVTTITRTGAGRFTIVFGRAFTNADYVVACDYYRSIGAVDIYNVGDIGTGGPSLPGFSVDNKVTTGFDLAFVGLGGAFQDPDGFHFFCYGNQ